jgi:hypothetical protein
MLWSSTADFLAVNHNPVVVVNGSKTVADAIYLDAKPGDVVVLVRLRPLVSTFIYILKYMDRMQQKHTIRITTHSRLFPSGSTPMSLNLNGTPPQPRRWTLCKRDYAQSSLCRRWKISRPNGHFGRVGGGQMKMTQVSMLLWKCGMMEHRV